MRSGADTQTDEGKRRDRVGGELVADESSAAGSTAECARRKVTAAGFGCSEVRGAIEIISATGQGSRCVAVFTPEEGSGAEE